MKKFNKFELVGIGISLLLICIFFSLLGKHVFGLEGDYLSAATTLFAAIVAYILYQDWREAEDYSTLREFILKIFDYHSELTEWQIGGIKFRHEITSVLKKSSPNLATTKESLAKILEFDRTFISYLLNIQKNLVVIEKMASDNGIKFNVQEKLDKYYDKAKIAYEEVFEEILKEDDNYLNTIDKIAMYGNCGTEIVGEIYDEIIVELINILPARNLKGH